MTVFGQRALQRERWLAADSSFCSPRACAHLVNASLAHRVNSSFCDVRAIGTPIATPQFPWRGRMPRAFTEWPCLLRRMRSPPRLPPGDSWPRTDFSDACMDYSCSLQCGWVAIHLFGLVAACL